MEEEQRDFYPPRFQVFLASSGSNTSTTLSGANIKFRGADRDLQYDIYLNPPNPDSQNPPVTSISRMYFPLSIYISVHLPYILSLNTGPIASTAITDETIVLGIFYLIILQ